MHFLKTNVAKRIKKQALLGSNTHRRGCRGPSFGLAPGSGSVVACLMTDAGARERDWGMSADAGARVSLNCVLVSHGRR